MRLDLEGHMQTYLVITGLASKNEERWFFRSTTGTTKRLADKRMTRNIDELTRN